ncbi:erythromycin biosynthesis sensory transduction protein EryC1 [Kitasatospora sp. MMS16-BH015]|uniref:DegT/DnrJ/EryC1/StrS family aminotransferase n=1 Tax=Kitasatospora sp. MMS16-BH015 TaxID=2018025 RepID=UPI000CA19FD7|nr:DegT/DnrJ/EryC1/StrS family aminotransferase [Kitasatospora sp. MMS16-BH015]AUG79370.1 erythromycin biosynthesis sensory transduction protein EryC1 [Kitasatospora sp. MMS16-BH015]
MAAAVPLVDLQAAHAEVAEEVRAGFDRVLSTGAYIKGPDVAEFEAEYAAFSGVRHAVGTANGTDALELALRALELPEGAGVVLPANTFVATAEAVVRAGLRPVLVDVDAEHLLIDPAAVADRLGGAAALMPVHLNGQLAPMEQLLEVAGELPVIEDGAQSQGATRHGRVSGSWGRISATSFYPGKNLGAYGDAGAVVTDEEELATAVRLIGDHGSGRKYVHERFGFNSRMDTLQAVVLRAKLRRLPSWNEARRAAAARYDALLADLGGLTTPRTMPGNEHVWHLYAVRVERGRDEVLAALQAEGIGAGVHYPVPVHLQPAFSGLGHGAGSFPVTERAAGEILTLPLFPQITEDQQTRVVEALAKALTRI